MRKKVKGHDDYFMFSTLQPKTKAVNSVRFTCTLENRLKADHQRLVGPEKKKLKCEVKMKNRN